jgi:hypothetical protein
MKDIYDIKPALEMGPDWRWWVWGLAALGAAAAVLLAWWWWRRRRKADGAPDSAPAICPEDEAIAELDRLAAEIGIGGKLFYFRLSAIARRYVERRFTLPAEEMTLEELLPVVDQLPVDRELREEFKALCRRCEPIKFADAPAREDDMARDLVFAREFVKRTSPAAVEAAPNGKAG